jgi:alpha-L-fucosidase 2
VHVLEGQLPFNKPGGGGQGMRYTALLGANVKGGKVSATKDGLAVAGASEVTLIVSAGTDWKDKEFAKLARQRLDAALARPFDAIRQAAVADHQRFMERCQLTLPEGPNSRLPTPDRVKAAEKTSDPALAALYFQFGRHLVVSGSRPDSQLPTNLQGIWAEEYSTPWRGDFHSNINLQMNYWPVEPANLSDCHLPLLRFIHNVAREGEKTARAYFHAPGWMANHTQNPWYDTSPSFLPACIGPTCGAWQKATARTIVRAGRPGGTSQASGVAPADAGKPRHGNSFHFSKERPRLASTCRARGYREANRLVQ